MCSSDLEKLGRPFEQVESQLTKTYHGSGLGLAIAKSLAGLHGGSIRLRSKLDVGTVVCVTLPRSPDVADATLVPRANAGKSRERRFVSLERAPQAQKNRARLRLASSRAADLPPQFLA